MQLDFLTPRVERLSHDGVVDVVHPGGVLGRMLRRPVLLLARDLCAFGLFQTAALPRGRRRQAAVLHARVAAPYVQSSSTLIKAGDDFGVWWWDADRVETLLAARASTARPLISPETLAQPRGEAWRIVRLKLGYEAQLWRGKALVASAWRRERYDPADWSAFVRLQRAVEPAPENPPAPADLPIAFDNRDAFALAPVELTREQLALTAGGGVVLASLCFGAFLFGQGYQLSKDTEQVEIETAEIRASTPRPAAVRNLDASQKKLIAYRQIEEQTSPLSAAGAAVGILAFHDLTPTSLNAETETLSFVLPYAAIEKIAPLVDDLESSGYFHDVQPRTDGAGQTMTLEMKVREAAPPLTPELN
ncbi:hypothetical protein [uncultured Brevundimonas sp.]|uniref:hypothetical protein n=1 Tax=uncultured Brevundimonas sp. TaxID=213418 RepID=UPI0025FFDA7B|nr:hypothetical protein [uncultured Brevundimonas sp.]